MLEIGSQISYIKIKFFLITLNFLANKNPQKRGILNEMGVAARLAVGKDIQFHVKKKRRGTNNKSAAENQKAAQITAWLNKISLDLTPIFVTQELESNAVSKTLHLVRRGCLRLIA